MKPESTDASGVRAFARESANDARRDSLWRWPIVLGVLTLSGLLTALVSDTWGDVWSWIALGIPVAVMTVFSWRRPSRG